MQGSLNPGNIILAFSTVCPASCLLTTNMMLGGTAAVTKGPDIKPSSSLSARITEYIKLRISLVKRTAQTAKK
jgi:hypothetical protein